MINVLGKDWCRTRENYWVYLRGLIDNEWMTMINIWTFYSPCGCCVQEPSLFKRSCRSSGPCERVNPEAWKIYLNTSKRCRAHWLCQLILPLSCRRLKYWFIYCTRVHRWILVHSVHFVHAHAVSALVKEPHNSHRLYRLRKKQGSDTTDVPNGMQRICTFCIDRL